ncbi:hypothetical protein ACDZ28_00635 (plasmid) [Paenibacillus sp. RS8]|uniref:hypothetical protein n=1 Tax=Paenibacillus sp. RS8 TaxID=3242681 RepID=UPI0035C13B11
MCTPATLGRAEIWAQLGWKGGTAPFYSSRRGGFRRTRRTSPDVPDEDGIRGTD